MSKAKKITYSIAFKVFLYFLLVFSFMAGLVFSVFSIYAADTELFSAGDAYADYRDEAIKRAALRHLDAVCGDEMRYRTLTGMKDGFAADSSRCNLAYAIEKEGRELWSNYDSSKTTDRVYQRNVHRKVYDGIENVYADYVFTVYVYPEFKLLDEFWLIWNFAYLPYRFGAGLAVFAVVCVLLFIICFIWLMCNAGRRSGQEGIVPGPLTGIPLEILTVIYGLGLIAPCAAVYDLQPWEDIGGRYAVAVVGLVLFGIFELVWFVAFCRELALRMKKGQGWKNTLLYMLYCLLRRIGKVLGKGIVALVRGLPLVYAVAAVLVLKTGVECMALMTASPGLGLVVFWAVEKLILVPAVLYCALAFKKLQMGSGALAEGNLSYKLDTKYLCLDFRRHADCLNRIGDGMAKAVEQKMRSERLKTELITNVSHDIKTPLTSVINYADLLGSEAGRGEGEVDWEKMTEYAEVLTRQANRLKKLLDDLLEASKANTGSLEVHLMPCEVGVLLTQATGEYEARFAQEGLKLHIRQPEKEVRILADGKHLWRVFDNLLGNICKYAQEGSRVYLDLEKKGDRVEVTFRNMSRYELNVSAQELEERFVRGDRSRNTEGNGLGLSIAKSLVELQNGSMEIVTDGDLFKVVLGFPVLAE